MGEAAAILRWVQSNFPYREDIAGVETLYSPRTMLRHLEAGIPHGDCDDFTILVSALAGSIGFEYRLATTQTREPGAWSHVYPELLVAGRWMAADGTNASAPLGWEAPSFGKAVDMDSEGKREALRGFLGDTPDAQELRVTAAKAAVDEAIRATRAVLERARAGE